MNSGGVRTDLLPDADGTVTLRPDFRDAAVRQQSRGQDADRRRSSRRCSSSNSPADGNTGDSQSLLIAVGQFPFGFDLSRPRGAADRGDDAGRQADRPGARPTASRSTISSRRAATISRCWRAARDAGRCRARSRCDSKPICHEPPATVPGGHRPHSADCDAARASAAAVRRSCAACGCGGRRLPA